MAKYVFTDGKLFAGGYDLSSNTNAVTLDVTVDEQDVTTINSNGFRERIGGLKDSSLNIDGFWEAGNSKPDDLLGANVGNEIICTVVPDAGVGNTAYFLKSKLFSYSMLGSIGEVTPFTVSKSNSTDKVVRGTINIDSDITATGASTGIQLGAVAANENIYAAIHCTGVSGTSTPTITFVLESDDNAGFTSATTRATFTGITAIASEIKKVSGAIADDYYRLSYTVSGTTPSFSIHATLGVE
jgi:hypothetical protein